MKLSLSDSKGAVLCTWNIEEDYRETKSNENPVLVINNIKIWDMQNVGYEIIYEVLESRWQGYK